MIQTITAISPRTRFSNVIISHPTTRYPRSTSLLHPDDPEVHVIAKVLPGGLGFVKPRQYIAPCLPKERKPRGEVTGFTKGSQRNFRNTLMRLDLSPFMCENEKVERNNGFFISVDWPKDSDWTPETLNKDLDRLAKRASKAFKSNLLGAVWKKEVKANGTPHLHVIILFSEALQTQDLRDWVKQAWTEITASNERYGTDVRPLYGEPAQLINYLLKPYCAAHGAVNVGRVWGKWQSKTLPLQEPEILGLSVEDYPVFLERLKGTPQAQHCKMIRDFTEKWNGGRVIGKGDILRQLLEDLPSDELQRQWGNA